MYGNVIGQSRAYEPLPWAVRHVRIVVPGNQMPPNLLKLPHALNRLQQSLDTHMSHIEHVSGHQDCASGMFPC